MNVNESKGWGTSKEKLEKTFKFKEFNDSIDFVNKVAKIAEKQNTLQLHSKSRLLRVHQVDLELKRKMIALKSMISDFCS
jgi:pterin-4a-carbinolamine dehydratase